MRRNRTPRRATKLHIEALETRDLLSYTITALGTLGGPTSHPDGINAAGQIVGEADVSGANTGHAFLYSNGQMTDLGTLGGTTSVAHAINNYGQMVGGAAIPNGNFHAFLYSNGQMTDLGTLGGAESEAFAINDAGQVAGEAETAGGVFHAFLYSNGQMTDLGTLGGAQSYAYGINLSGQVVGTADMPDSTTHAYLYDGTTMNDLGTLGGDSSYAYAITDDGQVVGESDTANVGGSHAFYCAGGGMIDLGTLGGPDSYATALNSFGQVVGGAEVAANSQHGFFFDGSTLTDLNDLIPADSGWVLEEASGISDAGLIAAWGKSPGGPEQAVLLTPDGTAPRSTARITVRQADLVAPPDVRQADAWPGSRPIERSATAARMTTLQVRDEVFRALGQGERPGPWRRLASESRESLDVNFNRGDEMSIANGQALMSLGDTIR